MKTSTIFSALILIFCIYVVNPQTSETSTPTQTAAAKCEAAQDNCKQCILADPECSWCADNKTSAGSRCRLHSANLAQCSITDIEFPDGGTEVGSDKPFSKSVDYKSGTNQDIIQLKPQQVFVKLRQGKPETVQITFRRVVDYPLDLYYVMDLSYSMRDDLQELQNLGLNLAEQIQNVTNNVRLGFGTFVDKVIMPYASTVPAQLEDPCANFENSSITCAPVFGFRNQLNITADGEAFRDAVQATKISGNIDSPEGGFDALMQIAVCQKQIQWRKDALHVVLFTTDSSSHIAKDGKLAAILDINDMQCHLEKGFNKYLPANAVVYAKSRLQDYPSIGQLKKVFGENKIHTIFAVTEEVIPLYQDLDQDTGKGLLENAFVRKLNPDSSNVVPIIREAYTALRDRIQMFEPDVPSNVELSYRVKCPGRPWLDNSLFCNNTKINEEAIFEFTLLAKSCPTNPNQKDTVEITGSVLDKAVLEIEYLSCKCECSNEKEIKTNSSSCSFSGDLECGLCNCYSGSSGQECQCKGDETQFSEEGCAAPPYTPGMTLCSGHGTCVCGKCACTGDHQGDYCECQSKGCPEDCGGSGQGTCINCNGDRRCKCNGDFYLNVQTGVCSCNDELCIDKNSNFTGECNGRGTCNCDKCDCTVEYSGPFCKTCVRPSCSGIDGTCGGSKIRDCAACIYENQRLNKEFTAVCAPQCRDLGIDVKSVNSLPDCGVCFDTTQDTTPKTEGLCKDCNKYSRDPEVHVPVSCEGTSDDSGCNYQYRIYWNTILNSFTIYVKTFDRETDCPKPIDPLLIVLPVIGAILLIGLLALLLWKLFQTIRDKHEYEQFMENQKMSQWSKGENPLFTKPTDRIENPAYVG